MHTKLARYKSDESCIVFRLSQNHLISPLHWPLHFLTNCHTSLAAAAGGRLAVVWHAVSSWMALIFVVLAVMDVMLRCGDSLFGCSVSGVVRGRDDRSICDICKRGCLWLV